MTATMFLTSKGASKVGYIRHSAAIATIPHRLCEEFKTWRDGLRDDFRHCVVGPIQGINGYNFIGFLPDGSKEGWKPSDDADAARHYMLAHFAMDGAFVKFGGDEGEEYAVTVNVPVRGWKDGDWLIEGDK